MPLECEKTGGHVWIEPYNEWAICDIHRMNLVWVFRITCVNHMPFRKYTNGIILNADAWFDREKMAQFPHGRLTSTLMVAPYDFDYFGYDGRAITDGG